MAKTAADKAFDKEAKALALSGPVDHVPQTDEERLAQAATRLRDRAVNLSGLAPSEYDAISDEEKVAFIEAAAAQLKDEIGKVPAVGTAPKGDLVRVSKDGVTLDVSPAALDQHLSLGWKLSKD